MGKPTKSLGTNVLIVSLLCQTFFVQITDFVCDMSCWLLN